jgi:hypothetical protein
MQIATTCHRIFLFVIVCIAILAGIDLLQEDMLEVIGFVVLLSVAGPLFLYWWMKKHPLALSKKRFRVQYVICFVAVLLELYVYILYVKAGPSDPDTAGHMHVFLFPLMYSLFSSGMIFLFWITSKLFKRKS